MIYIVVFLLLLIPVVRYDWMVKAGGEKGWYYFNLLVLILFAGLRYRIGGDTLLYMGMFEECPKLQDLKYFDFASAQYNPLWYILNGLSRSIYDDFFLFQLIHAFIVNVSFFHFFRKYCPRYYFTAILLYYIGYFCYFNMEVLRESLCVSVLLWATTFLLSRRWVSYYALCLIALLLHYSAAIMLLFPFLYIFKRPSCLWEIVILVVVVVCMSVVNLPVLLLEMFGINEQLTTLISVYMDDQRNIVGIISEFLNYLPILVCIWVRERYSIVEDRDFTFIVMGTVVVYGLAMNLGILNRFINYFVPFIIVYVVNTIYRVLSWEFRQRQVSFVACLCALLLYNFNLIRFYTSDLSDVYPGTRAYVKYHPYHSVLDKEIDEHRERFIENYRDISIQF